MPDEKLIDMHVHAPPFEPIDLGGGESFRLKETLALKYFKHRLGIGALDSDPSKIYLDNLSREIKNSNHVSKAVLLPLDGVYDGSGLVDAVRTRFMVSNDAVLQWARQYDVFIPACSVNPLRRDAIEELERCASNGAVLNKVLPNSQGFDPADRRLRAFWTKMSELKMPLLTHTGYEFALKTINNSYGNPENFVPALDEGVCVIFAHGGSSGVFFPELYFSAVLRLLDKYPNLYLDTSAMTLPTRMRMLIKFSKINMLRERLIFGTDYPVPAFAIALLWDLRLKAYMEARAERNYFDFVCGVLRRMGIEPDASLTRKILGV